MRIKILLLIFNVSAAFAVLEFQSRLSNFSVELLHNIVRGTDENVVISPYGLWSLLISMAYETSGVTREQFSTVLSLPEDRTLAVEGFTDLLTSLLGKRGVNLTIYNILICDKEDFHADSDSLLRLENDFNFQVQPANFRMPKEASDDARRYFMRFNFQSVAEIVRAEDFVNSSMIMCNYMTFEAKWAYSFNQVRSIDFYFDEKVMKYHEMSTTMRARSALIDFGSMTVSAIEVPFEGDDRFCMLLMLPLYGMGINSADEVYKNLRKVTLKDIFAKLKNDHGNLGLREETIKLPRCRYDSLVLLNRPLANMGLFSAFDDTANFSSIAKDDMYISEIAHRVKIEFTESHLRVYTTTPAYLMTPKRPPYESRMKPFVLFIMEKLTETVLFGGSFTLKECIPIN